MRSLISALILLAFIPGLVLAGRYYDARTGRFLQIDSKAQKFPGWSPYNYALNNPLRYIDPDGQEVRVFSEKLGTATMWRGGGVKGLVGAAFQPRHSFMRVTTDKIDVILELGGPSFDPSKGNPIAKMAEFEQGERADQQQHTVGRPEGVGENDYTFENKIIEIFQAVEQNLPDYNGQDGPNSNGFIKFLIEAAGGTVVLPTKAFGKDEVKAYFQKYVEHLKQQEEKKKEEEKKNETQRN